MFWEEKAYEPRPVDPPLEKTINVDVFMRPRRVPRVDPAGVREHYARQIEHGEGTAPSHRAPLPSARLNAQQSLTFTLLLYRVLTTKKCFFSLFFQERHLRFTPDSISSGKHLAQWQGTKNIHTKVHFSTCNPPTGH